MKKQNVFMIAVSMILLITVGCQSGSNKGVDTTKQEKEKEVIDKEKTTDDTLDPTNDATASNESTEGAGLTSGQVPDQNAAARCGNAGFDLMGNIQQSVAVLSGTPYSQPNATDCSGMFHKAVDRIRAECPKARLPLIGEARSTRGIAQWYHKHGDFQIIRDPANSGHLIKEGAVMFYGYGKRKDLYNYQTLTIDTLIVKNVGINHVSIVTKVVRENGKVVSYDMFHGRNSKFPAGVTGSELSYKHRPNLPPYGNDEEPWLAVANILAPAAAATD